jgi:hypothetical protein
MARLPYARQRPTGVRGGASARTGLRSVGGGAGLAFILLFLLMIGNPGDARAGKNAGGVLILHCNPTLQYTADGNYDGYSDLRDAKNAITQVAGDGNPIVYFVIAAFDDFASPAIKGLSFGIDMSSPAVEPVAWGVCGAFSSDDYFEISDDGWPRANTGTSVSWISGPRRQRLSEIYWLARYAYAGQTVKLIPHPHQTHIFVDDQVPPERDDIEDYGMVGFGVKGYNPMGLDDATGGCCGTSGQCIVQTKAGCGLYAGYIFQGDNTSCSPNPCTPGVGACCIRVECRITQWDECLEAGGLPMGEGVGCDPTPCDFSRVETTWGALKSTYRGW